MTTLQCITIENRIPRWTFGKFLKLIINVQCRDIVRQRIENKGFIDDVKLPGYGYYMGTIGTAVMRTSTARHDVACHII